MPKHDIGSSGPEPLEEPRSRLVLAYPRVPALEDPEAQDPPSYAGTMRGLGYAIFFELIAVTVVVFGWMLWRHFR